MATPAVGSWFVLAFKPKFLVPSLSLIGALLAGALVIALVRRWHRETQRTREAGEELARYRALYEQGTISEEEYRSLRAVLGGDLRRAMNLPAKAPPTAPPVPPEKSTEIQTSPGTPPGREMPPVPSDGNAAQ